MKTIIKSNLTQQKLKNFSPMMPGKADLLHQQCDCKATNATAMQLQYDCNTTAMRLWCDCDATAMRLRCDCNATAMQLRCSCNATAMQLLTIGTFGIKTEEGEKEKKLTSTDAFGYARHLKLDGLPLLHFIGTSDFSQGTEFLSNFYGLFAKTSLLFTFSRFFKLFLSVFCQYILRLAGSLIVVAYMHIILVHQFTKK